MLEATLRRFGAKLILPSLLALLSVNTSSSQSYPIGLPANQPQTESAQVPERISEPRETVLSSFADPQTGKMIDVVRIEVPVSVPRWQTEYLSEKRLEMQWVTETVKTTQVTTIPTDRVQWEPQTVGWLNPRVVYVPKPVFQPTLVPVEQPVRYPKYVEVERKVAVPKLVQGTEYRSYVVHRERSLVEPKTPSAPLATSVMPPVQNGLSEANRPNPIQDTAANSLAQRSSATNSASLAWQSPYALAVAPVASYGWSNSPSMQPILQLPGRPVANLLVGMQQSLNPANYSASLLTSLNSSSNATSMRASTYPATPMMQQVANSGARRDVSQSGMSASVLR